MARDPGGACVVCGWVDWLKATWVVGRGTICSRCLSAPPPRHHQNGTLMGASFERGLNAAVQRTIDETTGRRLGRDEAERLYPGRLHPHYGEPPQERPIAGALGGAADAPAEQEAETPKKTAAPVARESNGQNGDARTGRNPANLHAIVLDK